MQRKQDLELLLGIIIKKLQINKVIKKVNNFFSSLPTSLSMILKREFKKKTIQEEIINQFF
jgi:hypothetical protein